ncbi:hypothetical protein WA026_006832 [Henosepilachna vigintioctopunctata]|uniref:DUF4774 domain-containing protein n=1 Tax=Henosepilachna vigintioctopunctata TaxID=420089 RepID=A0AAW1UH26_9CUCU
MNIRNPKVNIQEKLYQTNTKTESMLKVLGQSPNINIQEKQVENSRPFIKINQKPFSKIPTSTAKIEIVDSMMRRAGISPSRGQIAKEDNQKRIGLGGAPSGEDTQVSHDANKKLFSKDNTGSGIFIHKLKVRRGGVAIAGPGGIATAGDGGTAIVGPNGYAYTQPDSLAIAGTGTKVIAVEPSVNLSELVKNNKTRFGGLYPQRLGKVVAVGPVIYYNKG